MAKLVRNLPWIFVSVAAILGFIRLENVVNDLNAEKARAIYAECVSVKKAVQPLHDIVIFATKPAAPSNDPSTQSRVDAVNGERAQARKDILPLIPNIKCVK